VISLELLASLRARLKSMNERNHRLMLRTSGALIPVREKPRHCPNCEGPWHVQKTAFHYGKTIAHGHFQIRETIHICARRCRYDNGKLVTNRSDSLSAQLIPGRGVGYDVMVEIGLQRFVHHRQREEIRSSLIDKHGVSERS